MTRRIRVGAWAVIVAIAAFQAWANRYAVSPDGISYLDLSDAVVKGRWSELANLYWSPLYPFLVGVARLIGGTGAEREVPVMHALNVAAFLGMFAAFEYSLKSVFALANATRGTILRGTWGVLAAYGLFGATALTMTPLELTTPDWLSNAAVLVALGAMLRLRESPGDRAAALALGVALGLGALAKSFMVPWALVCFVTLALALRRNARPALTRAMVAWALFVVPWSAVLSHRAGRLTFGDAGRLTWAWYVNGVDTPSLGIIPSGARMASTDAILPGVGVTGDAPGTNPVWYDPARWNTLLRPELSVSQAAATLRVMTVTLLASFSVLILLSVVIAVAPTGSRRPFLERTAVVLVPCFAGFLGYAMVIVTARYVMAFTLASVLVTLAGLPLPRRMKPAMLLIGATIPIVLLAFSPTSAFGFSFVTAILAAMLVGAHVPTRHHITWKVVVSLAMVFSLILFSPRTPTLMRLAASLFAIALWALAARAIRLRRPVAFARGALTALALGTGLVLAGRVALRFVRDSDAAERAFLLQNPQWRIARELARHGIVPGTRIAVIGAPSESYWARTARLEIVASVPDWRVQAWWKMPDAWRDSLLAQFAEHGAQVAIATRPPPSGAPDSSWTPLAYRGWFRKLK